MDKYYLIMDIGMTKTSSALMSRNGRIVEDYVYVIPSLTRQGAEAVYRNTADALHHVLAHHGVSVEQVLGIGVGAPGPLDVKKGIIIDSPMMGVKNFPMTDRLHEEFGVPVVMDNDGNLGALAEARCGMGEGFLNVLYMTVSTGCGGGAFLNGRVYRGAKDSAAEFGHVSIDPEGPLCPCGNRGCLEMMASGTAIRRKMAADIKAGKKSAAFEACGYDPEKVQGADLTAAAAAGDAYALELYKQEGHYLGLALAAFFNCFDPDVFVLGGGVTKANAFFHEEMMRTLNERTILPVAEDRVRYSEMNDRLIVYGAYYLIRDYLEEGIL